VEIAELESKIDQLEKEMRADIESISTAKVLNFKETTFKEGLTNVNLRITKNELQLKSVTESPDKRFPSEGADNFTSLLISPVDLNFPATATASTTTTDHRGELYYGYEHKDGTRTCCLARNEVEDTRLRQNGFNMVYYSYRHDDILEWMIRLSKESPAHLRGGGISISGGIGDSTTNSGGGLHRNCLRKPRLTKVPPKNHLQHRC
jgi:hypothetical protein